MNIYQKLLDSGEPYIIAEIGVNFFDIARQRSLDILKAAELMIDEAVRAGADAVKFQSYKAEKIASVNSPSYWDRNEEPTASQFELFKKFDSLNEKDYAHLAQYSHRAGIDFLSTPFDFEAVEYLDRLMPFYKVSSSDLTNLPFIKAIAQKNKPVFLSTGAAFLGEIEQAVKTVHDQGNNEICLMHCVLAYPTNYEDANLNMIKHLQRVFPGLLYGYSDHTRPDHSMAVLSTAFLNGATVLEKHFTLDKTLQGNDHYHAMDSEDLQNCRLNLDLIKKIGGKYTKEPLSCEQESRLNARRSIVLTRDMKKGETISAEDVTYKRPGSGISPADLNKVLNRRVSRDIKRDELLSWMDI